MQQLCQMTPDVSYMLLPYEYCEHIETYDGGDHDEHTETWQICKARHINLMNSSTTEEN